ncbi:MAG: M50 family metallopeptidase [Firmicutes bacterium]|nr:M50 family metallopeptidase [Bacillota bacterium]
MGNFFNSLLDVIVFFLIFLLAVFLHELGHIIGGRLGNMRFNNMFVGPFQFCFDNKFRIKLNLNNFYYFFGVCTNLDALDDYENLIERYFKALVGGPIMSLIVGIIGLIVYLFFKETIILLIALVSLAIGIATCFSDLKKAIEMKKNSDVGRVSLVMALAYGKPMDEGLLTYIKDHFNNLGTINKMNTENIMNIDIGLRFKIIGYINNLEVDVYELMKAIMKNKKAFKSRGSKNLLFGIVSSSILYILINDSNVKKAKEWYEFLNGIEIPKDLSIDYNKALIESILFDGDIEDCGKLVTKLDGFYKMKGYSQIEAKVYQQVNQCLREGL